jgi:hypothetical protein
MKVVTIVLVLWSTLSSLCCFPHSISYFNEFAGGPTGGPNHLLNSNIDWGQDLLFLEKWIQQQGNKNLRVFLAFDGGYSPFDLDIQAVKPWPFREQEVPLAEFTVEEGVYAIGVNLLHEYPSYVLDESSTSYQIDRTPLRHLRRMKPIAHVGYSIRIFSWRQIRSAYLGSRSAGGLRTKAYE